MQTQRDIQAQLRSLSIPTEQRPETHAGGTVLRWAVILLALLALGVGGFVYRDSLSSAVSSVASKVDKPAEVELITVSVSRPPGPQAALTATGKIVSDHTVSVATKVSGQIVGLMFEQGDTVAEGQVLAQIEDVLYRARRDEAAAHLERARANLDFQKINYSRVEGLLKSESAPSIEYADARRWLDEAQAQLAAGQALLASADKILKDTVVVAPISGVVLQRNVEVGDFVAAEGGIGANANARFAVIADMQKLRVEVDVSELDIARLHKDMPCTIVPDAYKDRRYGGHVMWLDPGANYAKATVQVKVRINDPDPYLRVEGSAQVTFLTEPPNAEQTEAGTGIWIPAAAVLSGGDGSTSVLAVADGRLEKRVVSVGQKSGDRVEITGGLSAGDSIAAGGLDALKDGQRVER